MICPHCNAINEDHAAYCKNCGNPLAIITPPPVRGLEQVINLFTAYIGILAVETLCFLGMRYLHFGYYRLIGPVFGLASLAMLVLIIANIKLPKVRSLLIVFLIIHSISYIMWNVMPLFGGGDARFFNF